MIYDDRAPLNPPSDDEDNFRSRPQPEPYFSAPRHLVRGIPQVGDPNYNEKCPTCNAPAFEDRAEKTLQINFIDIYMAPGVRTGLSTLFITGEMAGIGLITAPWAVANLGFFGFILLFIFGLATVYSSRCMSLCWRILEERYVECRQYPARNPFVVIAYHAFGSIVSYFTRWCINVTLFGAATVYLMLIAETGQKIFETAYPDVNFCTWLFIFSMVMSLITFIDVPKASCLFAISMLLVTMSACYLTIMQILLDQKINVAMNTVVEHNQEWTINQIYMSIGTLLFSYAGATLFPTIQSDFFKRTTFSRTTILSFLILSFLFTFVVIGCYIVYGDRVNPNALMSFNGDSWMANGAVILMWGHLAIGFLIIVSPITKHLEAYYSPSETLTVKHFAHRAFFLGGMIVFGQCVPNAHILIALIGTTVLSLTTFIMPSLFFLKLSADYNPNWPERRLPWTTRVYVYTIIFMGLFCMAVSVAQAIDSFQDFDLQQYHSCVTSFFQSQKQSWLID